MSLNLAGILTLIVAFQLFFMALFLLTREKDSQSTVRHSFLGIVFLLLGINMLDLLIQYQEISMVPPGLMILDDTFLLLYGPLIYLYVKSVINRSFSLNTRDWLSLLPFAFVFSTLLAGFLLNVRMQSDDAGNLQMNSGFWIRGIVILFYAYSGFYLWFSKKALWSYNRLALDYYSNLERTNLKWLHFIVNSFIVLCLMGMLQLLVPYDTRDFFIQITGLLLVGVLFVFIHRSLFMALRGSRVPLGLGSPGEDKYLGSSLSDNRRNLLAGRLRSLMNEKKIYLNPDITIKDVALELHVTSKELSQVVNQNFGKHFFSFINSYRLADAISMLEDPSNEMTIQEIMYASGFSSKSSFNTLFKKRTLHTPTAYRENFRPN